MIQILFNMKPLIIIKNSQSLDSSNPTDSNKSPLFIKSAEDGSDKAGKNRAIRIVKKPQSIIKRLKIQRPLNFNHVYNYLNIFGINEMAMEDSNYEESYFKTMFYLNTVERVQLRKHAVIITTKVIEPVSTSTEYIIDRFRSYGDIRYYELANQIERTTSQFLKQQNFMGKLQKSFDNQPLSRYIESMQDNYYMCKTAPNKLVISNKLLELLGQDPEQYVIQVNKYKMPLREIISTESYSHVIQKSISNLELLCKFLDNHITLDDLHSSTSLDFNDYVYTKNHTKIYCSFHLFMPTPQTSCIQIRRISPTDCQEKKPKSLAWHQKQKIIEEYCQNIRYEEAQILNHLIKLPESLLLNNKSKVAGYVVKPQFQEQK